MLKEEGGQGEGERERNVNVREKPTDQLCPDQG